MKTTQTNISLKVGDTLKVAAPAQAQPTESEIRERVNETLSEIAAKGPAQAQHSPLPWFVTDGGRYVRRSVPGSIEMIADCTETGRPDIEPANAAYIVRACNNAQRLADALNNLIGKIEVMNGCMEVNYQEGHEECYPEFDSAREALAEWSKSI